GLSDLDLPAYLADFEASDALASVMAIRPPQSYHRLILDGPRLAGVEPMGSSDIWLNGGYFAFRREMLSHIGPGEELVEEPFTRLIDRGLIRVFKHDGFFAPMDTFKDKKELDDRYA